MAGENFHHISAIGSNQYVCAVIDQLPHVDIFGTEPIGWGVLENVGRVQDDNRLVCVKCGVIVVLCPAGSIKRTYLVF